MIIKVCGMRDADNIREVAKLGIDMMGFVFYKDSPRYVQMISSQAGIIPDYSEERLKKATGKNEPLSSADHIIHPRRVGVFVDEMPQTIVTRVYNYALDFVQLQGNESRAMIENLKRTLIPDISPAIKVIKTLHITSPTDISAYKDYEGAADMFMFDIAYEATNKLGGNPNWELLKYYDGATPFLVDGHIGPNDAEHILNLHHPQFAGVNLNSMFETEPGVKDVSKLREFIDKIR
jgi:phosphoribosylanthranilate isomerase